MKTEAHPRKILGRAMAKALHDAGIVPGDLNTIARIVIDLKPSDVATMYVEYYGDERWLDVVRTFDGIEVRTRTDEPAK